MTQVHNKRGCYVYSTQGVLTWSMKKFMQLEFDAEWTNCQNIWFAPLWLTPSPWKAPQGLSGEIDLIETCRSHHHDTVGTSIICRDHPHPDCYEPQWGSAASSGGPLHFVAKIDDAGTWTMKKYSYPYEESSVGTLVSRYPNYIDTIHATKWGEDWPFHLMSDLYNGGGGDTGWRHCGTLNYGTQCKYTIANITFQFK